GHQARRAPSRATYDLRLRGEHEDRPRTGDHLPERDHAAGHRGDSIMARLSRRQLVVGGGVAEAALGLQGACALQLPNSPQAAKVHRVGFLTDSHPGTGDYEYFRRGLAEQGYVEGRDLVIDYRSAEGVIGRLPALVAELVSLPVDVIAAESAPSISAAKQA